MHVDGAPRDPKHRVWGGERIEIDAPPLPEQSAYRPEARALNIVFEDDAVAVVDKPPGLVVHPGSGNWEGTGVTPDFAMPAAQARDTAYERALQDVVAAGGSSSAEAQTALTASQSDRPD